MTRQVNTYTLDKHIEQIATLAPQGAEAVHAAFGGAEAFKQTLRYSRQRDRHYRLPQLHRDFFSAASGKGDVLAQRFQHGLLLWKQSDRPSLPALAEQLLTRRRLAPALLERPKSPVTPDIMLGRAIMLIALRGEMIRGEPPGLQNESKTNPYHNAPHFGAVGVLTSFLLERHQKLAPEKQIATLGKTMQLVALLAAFAHDIDHPGGGNPQGEPFALEDKSFEAIKPLLDAMGLPLAMLDDIHIILRTTSPNGPQTYLKNVMRLLRNGEKPTPEAVDPERHFPELDVLCERPDLAVTASMVHDADLYLSIAAGRLANEITSGRLTTEFCGIGDNKNFSTDEALAFLLDTIVGPDGFASPAARDSGNAQVEELRRHNRQRLGLS